MMLPGNHRGTAAPRHRPKVTPHEITRAGTLPHAVRRKSGVLNDRNSAIECVRPGPPHLGSEGLSHQRLVWGSGFAPAGHLRTTDRLAMSSTSPTRSPSTGRGTQRRRIRRLQEGIRPPTRKNNATNDFQREVDIPNSLSNSDIPNSLSNSGTHATNIGRSGRLSGGPETSLPMIVGWCWKCMVG